MRCLEIFGFKKKISLGGVCDRLFDSSFDALAIVDLDYNLVQYNEEFLDVFIGDCASFTHSPMKINQFFMATNTSSESESIAWFMGCVNDGTVHDIPLRAMDKLIRIGDLKIIECDGGWLFIFRNTLQFKERENKLMMDAQVDKLTGLLNRKGLVDRLSVTMGEYNLSNDFKVGVLFLDLDDFKPINDTYGHDAGDEILRHVAESLTSALPDYASISRIGGDEFVCVIPVCDSRGDLLSYGEEIISSVARNVVVAGGATINVKCSVGGALYPDSLGELTQDSCDLVSAILKESDTAMYHAKKSGKNKVYVKNV